MTITVGSSTPTGTYPITVTGNGGGIQQNTTVSLTVTSQAGNYDVGIDFRGTQNYVTDPAYAVFDNCVNDGTNPQTRTNSNGYSVSWQWSQNCNAAADQSNSIDPRLAGIGNVYTASGGETLTITVAQPGTYNIGFATGSAVGNQCGAGKCPNFIFKDGASGTQLFTVNPNNPGLGHFIDAGNNNWTAAQWPSSNQEQQVTLTGTKLTVSMASGNAPSIAHIRITYVQPQNFTLLASPASLSVAQGNQGTSTITTAISGGFNSAISLSASGMPSGTTVSFNPNPIPAPGSGSSIMTITVGSSTPTGTYPITVMGNGGGIQQSTTVTLSVTSSSMWQQGFDFRNSPNLVTDPPGATDVILTTIYPTTGTLTTYGWSLSAAFYAADRNKMIDPRLAGINYTKNGTPGAFYVDLPAPGTYNLSLAMGDATNSQCGTQCQVQFLDGANVLATVSGGPTKAGYFYDAQGNNWSAAQWPTNNVSQQVTLAGTQLTVLVGTNQSTGDLTPIAYVGVTQVSTGPTFALQAPASVSVGQGQYSAADVFTVLIGAFNSAINLSATGGPAGTTVTFNPSTIPAPGAGSAIMTINVPNNAPLGNYPLRVTAKGGGIVQNVSVVMTVTA